MLHLRPLRGGWPGASAADCERWTPSWEPGDGGVHLDLAGTERLHGIGLTGAARVCRLAAAGWGPLAGGAAPSRLAAALASALAARWARRRGERDTARDLLLGVPAGGVAAFLAPFPLSVLSHRHPGGVAALQRSGLRTLGDLQAVPPSLLASLLGAEGPRLGNLAGGDDREPLAGERAAGRALVAVTLARPLAGRLALAALLRATAARALLACAGGPASREWWELRVRRAGRWEWTRTPPRSDAVGTLEAWLALLGALWRRLPARRAGLTELRLLAGAPALRARPVQGDLFAPSGAGRLAEAWRRAGRDGPGALHLAAEELLAGWGAVWADPGVRD